MNGKKARQLRKLMQVDLSKKEAYKKYDGKLSAEGKLTDRTYKIKYADLKTGKVEADMEETYSDKLTIENLDLQYRAYKAIKKDYNNGATRKEIQRILNKKGDK